MTKKHREQFDIFANEVRTGGSEAAFCERFFREFLSGLADNAPIESVIKVLESLNDEYVNEQLEFSLKRNDAT